jgi:hypothetical protein
VPGPCWKTSALALSLLLACEPGRPSGDAKLVASVSVLRFDAAQDGGEVSTTFSISGEHGAPVGFPRVEVAYRDGSGWLASHVTPTATGYLATVWAVPVGLQPGTYRAALQVVSPAAGGAALAIPVSLVVAAAPSAPVLALAPLQLAFQANLGGSSPPAQRVHLVNTGTGVLPPASVEVRSGAGPSWLTASLSGAPTALSLMVRPDTAGMPAGDHSAVVVVTTEGAAGSPAALPVSLRIVESGPSLELAPGRLAFTSMLGIAPPPQTVAIANGGTGQLPPLQASVDPDGPGGWLAASVDASGAAPVLSVAAAPSGLQPGVYTAIVSVEAPGASRSPAPVDVALQVRASSGNDCPPGSTLRYVGGGGPGAPVDFGRAFFAAYCAFCHTSALTGISRQGAPSDVDFDTLAQIRRQLFRIDALTAKGPLGTNDGMPGSFVPARPSDGERTLLGQWIACGAP